jgi:hypothetical protein
MSNNAELRILEKLSHTEIGVVKRGKLGVTLNDYGGAERKLRFDRSSEGLRNEFEVSGGPSRRWRDFG